MASKVMLVLLVFILAHISSAANKAENTCITKPCAGQEEDKQSMMCPAGSAECKENDSSLLQVRGGKFGSLEHTGDHLEKASDVEDDEEHETMIEDDEDEPATIAEEDASLHQNYASLADLGHAHVENKEDAESEEKEKDAEDEEEEGGWQKAMVHCNTGIIKPWKTLDGAKKQCVGNCKGVYDAACDGKGPFFTCKLSPSSAPKSMKSCIYWKPGNMPAPEKLGDGKCRTGKLGFKRSSGLSDCQAFCATKPDCKYFTYYARGGCMIAKGPCEGKVTSARGGAIVYKMPGKSLSLIQKNAAGGVGPESGPESAPEAA